MPDLSRIEGTSGPFLRGPKEGLKENLCVSVDIFTIYRTHSRCRFTLKRNAFIAKKRTKEDGSTRAMVISRARHSDKLVFVDEPATNQLKILSGDNRDNRLQSLSTLRGSRTPPRYGCVLQCLEMRIYWPLLARWSQAGGGA